MKTLLIAGRLIIIHLVMLFLASLVDIAFLGFPAFTITCFAVAGVFTAIFCFGTQQEKVPTRKTRKTLLYTMIAVLLACALLFFLVAPLSGPEYSLPVKSFAVTEALTAFFLKHIIYNEDEKS